MISFMISVVPPKIVVTSIALRRLSHQHQFCPFAAALGGTVDLRVAGRSPVGSHSHVTTGTTLSLFEPRFVTL